MPLRPCSMVQPNPLVMVYRDLIVFAFSVRFDVKLLLFHLPLHFDVIFPLPSLVLAEDTPSSDDCDLTENLGKQIS